MTPSAAVSGQKQIRVLHVCSSLRIGGLERDVVEMVRSAPGVGLKADVAVLESGGELERDAKSHGARVFALNKGGGLDANLVVRLRSLVRRGGYDLIHAHNQGSMLYAGLAGRLAAKPVVGTRHGASMVGLAWQAAPRYRLLSRIVGRLCRYTICVGCDSLRVAREIDRLPESRLRLIYNGVDTNIFRPDKTARQAARAELGWHEDTVVLISVARLSPEKDPLLAVDAMGLAGPGSVLVFVGDGDLRGGLEARADALGLSNRVMLLGIRHDVPRLLAGADVFVNSSLSEGVSLSILEGMSTGLAVAATNVGGTGEIVDHGVSGLLSSANDPTAMGASLHKLIAGADLRQAMGRAGRQMVIDRFSLENMARQYAQLYRAVLGR